MATATNVPYEVKWEFVVVDVSVLCRGPLLEVTIGSAFFAEIVDVSSGSPFLLHSCLKEERRAGRTVVRALLQNDYFGVEAFPEGMLGCSGKMLSGLHFGSR